MAVDVLNISNTCLGQEIRTNLKYIRKAEIPKGCVWECTQIFWNRVRKLLWSYDFLVYLETHIEKRRLYSMSVPLNSIFIFIQTKAVQLWKLLSGAVGMLSQQSKPVSLSLASAMKCIGCAKRFWENWKVFVKEYPLPFEVSTWIVIEVLKRLFVCCDV